MDIGPSFQVLQGKRADDRYMRWYVFDYKRMFIDTRAEIARRLWEGLRLFSAALPWPVEVHANQDFGS